MANNRVAFPHLTGCMENLAPTSAGKGMCFHRSAALVFDLDDSAEIVVGVFRAATPEERAAEPLASKVPFIHCWVEVQGGVLAPSLIEKMGNTLRRIDRDHYYAVNGVTDVRRMTRKQLIKAARGSGLAANLKYGHPLSGGRTVGMIVLEGCGVDYELTEFGTVVPVGSLEAVS